MAPRDRKPGSKPPGAESNPSTPVDPSFATVPRSTSPVLASAPAEQVLEDRGKEVSATARDSTGVESTRRRSGRKKGEMGDVGDVSDDRMDVDG